MWERLWTSRHEWMNKVVMIFNHSFAMRPASHSVPGSHHVSTRSVHCTVVYGGWKAGESPQEKLQSDPPRRDKHSWILNGRVNWEWTQRGLYPLLWKLVQTCERGFGLETRMNTINVPFLMEVNTSNAWIWMRILQEFSLCWSMINFASTKKLHRLNTTQWKIDEREARMEIRQHSKAPKMPWVRGRL